MLGLISADSQSTTFASLSKIYLFFLFQHYLSCLRARSSTPFVTPSPIPPSSLKITPNMSIVSMHNSAWLLSIDGIYPLRNVDCSNYLLS